MLFYEFKDKRKAVERISLLVVLLANAISIFDFFGLERCALCKTVQAKLFQQNIEGEGGRPSFVRAPIS